MIQPGIYPNVPFDEYQTWEAVSNSFLAILQDQSPLHAKYYKDHPAEDTPALLVGRAAHCLALEPSAFERRYAVAPVCDRRTKEGKQLWAEFESSANGRYILSQEQHESIRQVAESINRQIIHRFIEKGEAEVCIVWNDKKTDVLCKARLDYVHRGRAIIVDLKTTTDASPKAFQRAMWAYRYYQQAAFYVDGYKVLTGDEPSFVFLPVEKEPPYAVAAFEVHEDTVRAGKSEYRKALQTYADCVSTGIWPGYADEVKMINLSDWALKESGIGKYEQETEND